jgi:hypothetical protein
VVISAIDIESVERTPTRPVDDCTAASDIAIESDAILTDDAALSDVSDIAMESATSFSMTVVCAPESEIAND